MCYHQVMPGRVLPIAALLFFLFFAASGHTAGYTAGWVVDAANGKPIPGAYVSGGGEMVLTDQKGAFLMTTQVTGLSVRAYGYLRAERSLPFGAPPTTIGLFPFTPKALYLTVYGIGSKVLRNAALKLIEETELNALVIDVKGDRGIIPYKSTIPLAAEIGAQKVITVRDLTGLVTSLKAKGIYAIARIVVFKDNPLAASKTALAIKTAGGAVWRDRENLAWVDPARAEAWDYNIAIAEEAARAGFDEIQFDYVRFPDARGLQFSVANTEENRTKAITGFLAEARRRLQRYNVFLAADVFGYVCWNLNDTLIGQKLEDLPPVLDYLCPMLYPSGFQYGIPGYRNPVAHPSEIISLSLRRAAERTRLQPVRFRPWLQAFRDYAFDRRHFTGAEIRSQIDAAERFGSDGWMLWNPHNVYSSDGLKPRKKEMQR